MPDYHRCVTPDQKIGLCIKIRSCKPLINLLQKEKPRPSEKTIEFLRESHCGFEGIDPVVCCPKPEINDVSVPNNICTMFLLIC